MMKKICLILLLVALFPVHAQSESHAYYKNIFKTVTEKMADDMPDWYSHPPSVDGFIYYTGFGVATNSKVAREIALTIALTDLAEFLEEGVDRSTSDYMGMLLATLSTSGFKIVQAEEKPCKQNLICSYILIEYPLSLNKKSGLESTNDQTADKGSTVPSWYNTPMESDEHYHYFAGYGSNQEKEKAINLAVIDSIKLRNTYLHGSISSLNNTYVDETTSSIKVVSEGITKIIIKSEKFENFLSILEFVYDIAYENEIPDFANNNLCHSTSFLEDVSKQSDNAFEYILDYACQSKDFNQIITVIGRIPQKTFIHHRWGSLDKIKVYKQADGNYSAYVLIKLDAKELDEQYKKNIQDREMEIELIKSEAFKELEEEIKSLEESNDNN